MTENIHATNSGRFEDAKKLFLGSAKNIRLQPVPAEYREKEIGRFTQEYGPPDGRLLALCGGKAAGRVGGGV